MIAEVHAVVCAATQLDPVRVLTPCLGHSPCPRSGSVPARALPRRVAGHFRVQGAFDARVGRAGRRRGARVGRRVGGRAAHRAAGAVAAVTLWVRSFSRLDIQHFQRMN